VNPFKRRLRVALLAAQVVLVLLVVRNFFYVTSWRLYLDGPMAQPGAVAAGQRFEVEGAKVVPQIVAPEDDRLRFAVRVDRPSTLRFEARPTGRASASYEIALVRGGERQVLARGDAALRAVSQPLPPFEGLLELANHGAMIWADVRIVRNFHFVSHLAALALLAGVSVLFTRRDPAIALGHAERQTALNLALLGASIVAGLAMAEVALRMLGPRLGQSLAAQRRDLGEAWPNPRWQETPRYGARLRAGLDTYAEVSFGDIVWMGFVPPEVAPARTRRFPFRTDAEGFRNAAVRDPIAVAALGDSFTDAMTLPVEQAWPARLEARLGAPVQNYGTAGFGPQQEARILEDYALRHRPRAAVVAFFAGNDIFNAESFDDFERAPERPRPNPPGWRIKDTMARFDELYLVSLVRAAGESLHDRWRGTGTANVDAPPADDTVSPPAPPSATFDRGMFTLPVGDRALRVAFMPPYLDTLRFSAEELRARRGWALTRRSLERMQALSRAAGTELVVMFVPFKEQVYLPLLRRSFSRDELQRALAFSLRGIGPAPDPDAMARHRLAQNDLVRTLCAELGIALLDLTPVLEAELGSGRSVYFPDDSHWNAAGHDVAAAALAEFLQTRGILRARPGP
jgi:lysophospholipase L1-like esterase